MVDLIDLAKKRFGVLQHILDTQQFKPIVSFKAPQLSDHILLESTQDLLEMYNLAFSDARSAAILITV